MQQIALAPLLFYSLCFLLGIASKLLFHPFYLPILALLLFFWKDRIFSGCIVCLIGFVFAAQAATLPSLPEEGVLGKGIFTPDSIAYGSSPFGVSLITKGSLETFTTESRTWKRVPCQIYTPLHKMRSQGKCIVEGRLIPKKFPHYVLKTTQIETKPSLFSLTEWRFRIKQWTRKQFTSLFPQKETASFLLSMVTGEIDDRLMSLQFNRLGLLHLLGISGFQFSLLASLLGSVLKSIFSRSRATYLLIFLLSAYAIVLGNSPPIQRAYISSLLYAVAHLAGFQISALNALGAGLIWVLLLDPCVIFQLGFQFSFLCTAAIFIVYPLFKQWIKFDRSFSQIRKLRLLDRIGHTLLFFCSDALALNLAIHLVSLPLLFYHFHKIPLLSLAYNLFLPAVVSIAYLFLIPGLILYPFSHIIAVPFLKITEFLTNEMLLIATNPPTLFDFQWRVPGFTLGWTLLSLTVILALFLRRQSSLVFI